MTTTVPTPTFVECQRQADEIARLRKLLNKANAKLRAAESATRNARARGERIATERDELREQLHGKRGA
ncbi:hypothetical protein [Nocardia sp. NPDC055049]